MALRDSGAVPAGHVIDVLFTLMRDFYTWSDTGLDCGEVRRT